MAVEVIIKGIVSANFFLLHTFFEGSENEDAH